MSSYSHLAGVNYGVLQTELNQQILSAGETLNEPETPEKEHARFVGWYTDVTEGELFDAFGEEGELTESIDTVLYARYETVFYVYYMDEKHEKVIFTQKDDLVDRPKVEAQ